MSDEAKISTENRLLVEVGWEVCWQLGGIYTVLRSKAPAMVKQWGSRYCMVGPYNQTTASVEFEPLPRVGYFGRAATMLEERGIKVHYGRWLITGEPLVILIDYLSLRHRLNEFKYFVWRDHNIATRDEMEVNDVILFGYGVVEFLECLTEVVKQKDSTVAAESELDGEPVQLPILGQFHEWMAGVPIPVIGKRGLPIATTFTTHATLLGRYLAASDPYFYDHLNRVDPHRAAVERNIMPRYTIERAATWGAKCFTTISEITAVEAEKLLGRRADVLTPNGLNIQRFTAIHEFQNLHLRYKEKIHEFVMGHFFPYYTMDLDNTLYIFTAGRYEYRNKGLDLFIESLARLNWRLKSEGSNVNVVAFIVTKAPVSGINVDVLKNLMMFNEIRTTCNNISRQMGRRLLSVAAAGKSPQISDLLDEYDQLRLKRMTYAWKQNNKWPAVVTHSMMNDSSDLILNQIRSCQLLNQPDNPVKVVYYPEFVTATSPLLGLDYEQFVRGCHLGVFPSYYEPWGYTPQECTALGVPSITSDLAGFGSYVDKNIPDHDEKGIYVVPRRYKSFGESAQILSEAMTEIVTMNRRERVELRNRVEMQAELFDWKRMVSAYNEAHEIALSRTVYD